jgi:hypothetical protein
MSLAFLHGTAPDTPLFMAALLGGARRPRWRPHPRDWLRLANRLAAGLPPSVAALPEGGSEAMVRRMLERADFRAIVEETKAFLAEPPEAQRRRLVSLARQALERALLGNDAPVACFVLEEEAHGHDPAVTLAEGVLQAKARSLHPPAEAAATPGPRRRARPHRDPLRAMMHRGAARMREDVQVEEALRHAALAAGTPPPRTTAAAAPPRPGARPGGTRRGRHAARGLPPVGRGPRR